LYPLFLAITPGRVESGRAPKEGETGRDASRTSGNSASFLG
jgi:hypothetical protein